MTNINIDTDVLLRALDGDSAAQREARELLRTAKPTTGLLGRWAKHSEYGDVLITSEKVRPAEIVFVAHLDEEYPGGTREVNVPLDDLTFPEQTTDPDDVPPGEAWLVEVGGKRFHAIKAREWEWHVPEESASWWQSADVTLISPLVPARPTGGDHASNVASEQGSNLKGLLDSSPRPEDVPVGEAWMVESDGQTAIGYRNDPEDRLSWTVVYRDNAAHDWMFDEDVTLIARLAPETTEQDDVLGFDPAYTYRDRDGNEWRYVAGGWRWEGWLGIRPCSTPPAVNGPYTRIEDTNE